MARVSPESGQASVELVAVVPFVILAALAAWQIALAGHTLWLTAGAAGAAARADTVGASPERAAPGRALPEAMERGLWVERVGAGWGAREREHAAPVAALALAGRDVGGFVAGEGEILSAERPGVGQGRNGESRSGERGATRSAAARRCPCARGVPAAVGRVRERLLAANAAEQGALALAAGGDARTGVREALPGWSRARAHVNVAGGEVSVRLRPPVLLRALGERLTVTGEAAVEAP